MGERNENMLNDFFYINQRLYAVVQDRAEPAVVGMFEWHQDARRFLEAQRLVYPNTNFYMKEVAIEEDD